MRLRHFVAVFALFLSAGGSTEAGVVQTAPENVVAFTVPDGWAAKSNSNGIRFGRAAAPAESTVLSVSASPRDPKRDLKAQRALRQSQARQQGFRLVVDNLQQLDGWEAWESVTDATRGGEGPIMHSFHLFSPDIQAEVTLIAAKSDYPKYKEDLLLVVRSLRKK